LAQHNREKTASDSSRKITDAASLLIKLNQIKHERACSTHRHLLVIESNCTITGLAGQVFPFLELLYPGSLSISDKSVADSQDRADQISRYLGTEHPALLFEATGFFDPGLLAAVASTIKAGGILVLLISDGEHWPAKFTDSSDFTHSATSRFIRRFIDMIDGELSLDAPSLSYLKIQTQITEPFKLTDQVARLVNKPNPSQLFLEPDNPLHTASKLEGSSLSSPSTSAPKAKLPSQSAEDHQKTWLLEQNELLETIWKNLDSGTSKVLIIEAARGRGKSALLGRLAARWQSAGRHWSLTSSRRASVDTLEAHWKEALVREHKQSDLPWYPADQTQALPQTCLFVDEAADIPLPRLLNWVEQHSRLVLATTTSGYEGSGRGFGTRFLQRLDESKVDRERYHLQLPIRFGENDPVENFLNRVLLLEACSSDESSSYLASQSDSLQTQRISQDDLLQEETQLIAIYGLLREAHYQSTPMDLVHLLDASNIQLYTLTLNSTVLAVVMAAREGEIDHRLHESIMGGQRRLKDQLLPQLLARMANQGHSMAARYLRIVRIAVAPGARRHGLGSQLLRFVEADAGSEFDALGASYSRDSLTAAFWKKNGYRSFHEGYRIHPKSGYRTAAVLRTTKEASSALNTALNSAVKILRSNQKAAQIDSTQSLPETDFKLSDDDRQLAYRFSQGARSFHDSRAALLKLWHIDPDRKDTASLKGLQKAVATVSPKTLSRKRQDALLRQWAADTLRKRN